MVPTLYFDQSSLGLWFIRPSYDPHGYAELACKAYGFDMPAIDQALHETRQKSEVQSRQLQIIVSVWHEIRHFLDSMLTNHGFNRIAHYLRCYLDLPRAVGTLGRETGRIFCPVDSYIDPVLRDVFGLPEPNADLQLWIKQLVGFEQLLGSEHSGLQQLGTEIEFGERAQLESLAFIVESATLRRLGGTEKWRTILIDSPDLKVMRGRYHGILSLSRHNRIPDKAVMPLIYGGLATAVNYDSNISDIENTLRAKPSSRFLLLLDKLFPDWSHRSVDASRAWSDVNSAAKALWGATCIDEMKRQLDQYETACEELQGEAGVESLGVRSLRDVVDLRRKLMHSFEQDPTPFLDPDFSEVLLSRVKPPLIVASPHGETTPLPNSWLPRLWGQLKSDETLRWWWTASPRLPEADSKNILGLRDTEAWRLISTQYAPVVKMLIRGRRQRCQFGPEFMTAEIGIARDAGWSLIFDPAFRAPKATLLVDRFWWWLPNWKFTLCRGCGKVVTRPLGNAVSAWVFRANIEIADWWLSRLGLHSKNLELASAKDWTDWVVCDSCYAEIATMVGDSLLAHVHT
jgi:hypothetical protein